MALELYVAPDYDVADLASDLEMTDLTSMDLSETSKKGIMSLPRELRDQIYLNLLPPGFVTFHRSGRRKTIFPLMLHEGRLMHGIKGLGLLRASSTLHIEFSHKIYCCTFVVSNFQCEDREGIDSIDFEAHLPKGPARDKIRKLHLQHYIMDTTFHNLPDLRPLARMPRLSDFTLSVAIDASYYPAWTDSSLEKNMVLNGLAAHVCRFVHCRVCLWVNSTSPSNSAKEEDGWLWISTDVLLRLLEQYKALQPTSVGKLLCEVMSQTSSMQISQATTLRFSGGGR